MECALREFPQRWPSLLPNLFDIATMGVFIVLLHCNHSGKAKRNSCDDIENVARRYKDFHS